MKKLNYLLIGFFCFVFHFANAQKAQQPAADRNSAEPILVKDPVTQCTYRYHYYPNLGAYYDAKTNIYIFRQNGEWKKAKEIPSGYMGYSLNNKVNVVISDYDGDDPTQFIKIHRKMYPYNFHQRLKEVSSSN